MSRRYEEGDLDDEVASHLEIETQENIERGMAPEEARYAALRKFGSVALTKELCREARGLASLDRLRQDFRFAVRLFLRTPAFTAAAILSIALGIGVATSLFSVVDTILFRPLPYAAPDRLVALSLQNPTLNLGFDDLPISAGVLRQWRRETATLEQLAEYKPNAIVLTGGAHPERVIALRAAASLFPLLGVKPALGRTYTAEEDQPGRDDVVVIGDTLWKRRFGADPSVIGRTVVLEGRKCTIIGVMPPGFHFPGAGEMPGVFDAFTRPEIWIPLALSPAEAADFANLNHFAVARLRRGAGPGEARAELTAAIERIVRESNDLPPGWNATVVPLADKVAGGVRTGILLLFGAVGLLLAITCANVASLLLSRAARRRGEMGIRLSLGASRLRLLRQVLSESLLLGICGGVGGVAVAYTMVRLLPVAIPPGALPRMGEISIDGRVLAFSLGLTILTALLFGIAPALQCVRAPVGAAVKTGGRSGEGAVGVRTRQALVVGSLAVTLVLLTGAVLLARSFVAVIRTPGGFEPDNLLTANLPMAPGKYGNWRVRIHHVREIVRRCENVPGVQAAGVIDLLPLTGENNISNVTAEGVPVVDRRRPPVAEFRGVTPGYFRAMGIPLKRGRLFNGRDTGDSPPVGIISETAARRLWSGIANPVGRRFKRGEDPKAPWVEIVGIVGDVRSSGLETEPRPQIYRPYEQDSRMEVALAVRFAPGARELPPAIRNAIWSIDKDQPVEHVLPMREVVAESVAGRRFRMLIFGLFGGIAVLLASVGLYGVVSYTVALRTHEIGLRMAVGATSAAILGRVLNEAARLALLGGVLGLAGAYAATRFLSAFLYGVSATDRTAFAIACGLLLIVVLAASWIPARRAAQTDPVAALRCE